MTEYTLRLVDISEDEIPAVLDLQRALIDALNAWDVRDQVANAALRLVLAQALAEVMVPADARRFLKDELRTLWHNVKCYCAVNKGFIIPDDA